MIGQLSGTLGQLGISRKPMGAPQTAWWLAGGIDPANCVCAYRAIGASSYAQSLVNLTGNSTYNLQDPVAPPWNAATGWSFGQSVPNAYLVSAPVGYNSTVIIELNYISGSGNAFGYMSFRITLANKTLLANMFHSNTYKRNVTLTSGDHEPSLIVSLSRNSIFVNGDKRAGASSAPMIQTKTALIGALGGGGDTPYGGGYYFNGNVLRVANYDTNLTDSQIAAVMQAMRNE